MMSALATRRSAISMPRSCFMSSVRLRLPRLSQANHVLVPWIAVSYARAKSPSPMRSTLTTSAPRSQRCRVASGAATACSKATTRTPANGIEYESLSAISAGSYETQSQGARRYDAYMTEREDAAQRWARREARRKAERERLQKHGGGLRRVYLDAVRKRAEAKKNVT